MGYAWLNLGSLLLGLTGWVLPVVYLSGRVGKGRPQRGLYYALSMGACAASLWMQLRYGRHLVDIQDWSALMDTAGAVCSVALFLLVSTLLENLAVLALDGWLDREG